ATLLADFGLPSELLTLSDLSSYGRSPQWFDPQPLFDAWRALVAATGLKSASYLEHRERLAEFADAEMQQECSDRPAQKAHDEHMTFWTKEIFTRTVCQYLNSGFPCLL